MAAKRRRGEQLETAILEAAYNILCTSGYELMTFQNVAKQAGTSRTVLYGRYSDKVGLLYALVQFRFTQAHGGNMVDLVREQGSLREDLLSVVKLYQEFLTTVGAELMGAILFELSVKNVQLQRLSLLGRDSNIEMMQKIQEFAKRRGEIHHEFTNRQMSLPFDLLRFENMVRGGDVTENYLMELVDEVLLPVYLNT
ncbi:TetR/AcrR family transcriptional regulator [Paenibacillus sanguinis]|uniref:TetR/AcrR family transcriptional regulator n=1 Tax=Paenibacillus sanguinis TaxID=225906 RepID=UPI000375FCAD|nr:TetR/AcrR family transcriptional regulator [Paenibacillus sanguinis]